MFASLEHANLEVELQEVLEILLKLINTNTPGLNFCKMPAYVTCVLKAKAGERASGGGASGAFVYEN